MYTGYNCARVEELRTFINSTARQAGNGIVGIMYEKIIVPMSSEWYAPEAVEFFEGLAQTVRASGESITSAYDAFRDAVQQAGTSWAENTGGEVPVLASIDAVELNLDVSPIREKNALGDVIINGDRATAIANTLGEVQESINQKLRTLASELDAEAAFLGNGQSGAVQACFERVSAEISKIFKYLTDGDESLYGQINKAVKKYGDVSSSISEGFNNSVV